MKGKLNINWSKPSDMISLYDYYGKPQGESVGSKVYNLSVEDRVSSQLKDVKSNNFDGSVRVYPRTWLDKLDFIERVHEDGAASDKEIINQIVAEYEAK